MTPEVENALAGNKTMRLQTDGNFISERAGSQV